MRWQYDTLSIREADQVVELALNRPERRNALSTRMAKELVDATDTLACRPDVHAVVVTSAVPRVFCVGADLKERVDFSHDDFMRQRIVFRAAFDGIRELPMPVVAGVSGWALGGGFEIALCCDLIVADEDAVFGLPEVTLGIVPGGGGTQTLARRVGPGKASDLLFTGRKVDVAEADALPTIDRRVPAGQAGAVAFELAQQIAANSPVAVRNAKAAMRRGLDTYLAAGLDIEDSAWRTAIHSADRAEGVAAFVEKRRPRWPSS